MDILVNKKENVAKITIKGIKDRPGLAAYLFTILGNKGYNIEMISQGGISNGRTDLSFTLIEAQAEDVVKFINEKLGEIDALGVEMEKGLGMITIMGEKFIKTPGVAGKILEVFAQHKINIELISTSFTTMSLLVKEEKLDEAFDAVKKKLEEIS